MDKKAVIILGHGSRNVDSVNEQIELNKLIEKSMPTYEIKNAFLQLCEPNIEVVLSELINANYNHIIVVPLLLFAGNHLQHDIPDLINKYRQNNPNVTIVVTKHLGVDAKIVELVQNRIATCEV